MAEFDSDLEENDESVIIHNEEQTVITHPSSTPKKKRAFNEIEHAEHDDLSPPTKVAKLNGTHNHKASNDLDSFLEDSNDDLDEDQDDEEEEEDEDDDLSATKEDGFQTDGVIEGISLNADAHSMLTQEVEFEVKDIYEGYYHEVRDILAATDWDQKKLHVGMLADTVVKQEEIGGVLMSQDSVLGFITLLPLHKYFEHLSLSHIKRFLLNKCKSNKEKKRVEKYLGAKSKTGLLLHERPINCPMEIVAPIYESLLMDYEYATDKTQAKHLSEDEVESFKCEYVMLVVRYRWFPLWQLKKKMNQKQKKKKGDGEEEEGKNESLDEGEILLPKYLNDRSRMQLVYEHMEHDLFVKKAEFQFDFERNDKIWNVVFVKMEHLRDIVDEMKATFV